MVARAFHPVRSLPPCGRHLGFSLVELLLAIFILGIGVISIAALFPAGIAQQRQSGDDVIGPIVANNALSILRSKLKDRDFAVNSFGFTVEGDFPWSRPAFFRQNATLGSGITVPAGSISIFDASLSNVTNTEIPFNGSALPANPIIVTQGERAYPEYSTSASSFEAATPEYFWECMFRRFQGRVYVAVFVYRVNNPPGDRSPYAVSPNPSDPDLPPLPISLDLASSATYCAEGPWDAPLTIAAGANVIEGTAGGTPYDPFDDRQAWQEPRQWILDQNNNIHRVLGQFRDAPGDPNQVELLRAVEPLAPLPVYFTGGNAFNDVVTNIWYIPKSDGAGRILTPVYLVVEEL